MKSIQTKFIVLILGCILLSSSMIGGAGILNAKHVVDEDSVKIMNLMCKEKKQEINALSRESSNRSRRWRSTSASIPNLRRRHRACFEAKRRLTAVSGSTSPPTSPDSARRIPNM